MAYDKIIVPQTGKKVEVQNGQVNVPDNPIIPFIEGDGIGSDITAAAKRVLDAAIEKAYAGKRKIVWMEIYAGEKAANIYGGNYMPAETLDAIKEFIIAIKGPLTTPIGGGFRSLNVTLRQTLDLYACVRPVRWYTGVPSPVKHPENVNMVIFRENTEDVYAGIEYEVGSPENETLTKLLRDEFGAKFFDGSGIGIKPISAFASKRLVRKAIQYAIEYGFSSVTLVHKGNIQKFTEGAFRKWGYEVAHDEFGDVTITEADMWDKYDGKQPAGKILIKDRIADIIFQHALLRPKEFGVLATTNLNGDYLSDALAAQVGGMGVAPGANIGDFVALFEATHGTAPKYTKLDKVNPGSLIFSGVMMLEYMGWHEAAELIRESFKKTVAQKTVTYDFARQMDGATTLKTSEFGTAMINNL